MKARLGLVALATGSVVLGLLVPTAVTAAPKVENPSGQALVRIDGGTAYAKKKAKREYRIVVPDGASITWMGDVAGKGLRVGTFSPKAMAGAWNRLGFRDGARAYATLTWEEAGDVRPTARAALLWAPRVNADGQLTFLAKVGSGLPRELPGFTINIARRDTDMNPSTRARWTTAFPTFAVHNTVGLQATVSDDKSATVTWTSPSGSTTTCRGPLSVGTSDEDLSFPGFPCGDGTVNSKDKDGYYNQLAFVSSKQASDGNGQVVATFSFTPTGTTTYLDYSMLIAQWDSQGRNKLPPTP